MANFKFDAALATAEFVKLRDNTITVANKAEDVARVSLAGLIDPDSGVTQTTLTLLSLAAYGNPKPKNPNKGATISWLQYAKGGETTRNLMRAVFGIADCFEMTWQDVDGNATTERCQPIVDAVNAFIDKDKGAAKTISALVKACNKLSEAWFAERVPELAPIEGEGEGEGEGEEVSLASKVLALAKALAGATPEQLGEAETALVELLAAIDTASARIVTGEPVSKAA